MVLQEVEQYTSIQLPMKEEDEEEVVENQEEEENKKKEQQDDALLEEKNPLIEQVEKALDEALEMLLFDDDLSAASVDHDSVTTVYRNAAEQSLRDELALADSGYCHSHRRNRVLSFDNRLPIEDDGSHEGWWVELKNTSMAETTSITEASSSWSSSAHSPERIFSEKQVKWSATPHLYWENLLKSAQLTTNLPQRMDLTVANNLLAIAWDKKHGRRSAAMLWLAWKQQLDEHLQKDDLNKLCARGTFHVVALAVPVMGSAARIPRRSHRCCSLTHLTDDWRLYARNDGIVHMEEIE